MSKDSSFDIICKIDTTEIKNVVQHTERELTTRFDFKGSKSRVELGKDNVVELVADDEFKLGQLRDIFSSKLTKRGIDADAVSYSDPKPAGHMTVSQKASFQSGISSEDAKKITKTIKAEKLKVQASIQGEQVRVTGKNRDDLQECIRILRNADLGFAFQVTNYR